MSDVLEQLVRDSAIQVATSVSSMLNNSTESRANSTNSSVSSVDTYTAEQNRAATAAREKSTAHIGSGQQAPPPSQDLAYFNAHTRPTQAPGPIVPYPRPYDRHLRYRTQPNSQQYPEERTAPMHRPMPTTYLDDSQGDQRATAHGFTSPHSGEHPSLEGAIKPRDSHSDIRPGDDADEPPHNPALDQVQHPLREPTEHIPKAGLRSPRKPKSAIANLVQRISRKLMPKNPNPTLKGVFSLIPRWLSRRKRHIRVKADGTIGASTDAGGGKTNSR